MLIPIGSFPVRQRAPSTPTPVAQTKPKLYYSSSVHGADTAPRPATLLYPTSSLTSLGVSINAGETTYEAGSKDNYPKSPSDCSQSPSPYQSAFAPFDIDDHLTGYRTPHHAPTRHASVPNLAQNRIFSPASAHRTTNGGFTPLSIPLEAANESLIEADDGGFARRTGIRLSAQSMPVMPELGYKRNGWFTSSSSDLLLLMMDQSISQTSTHDSRKTGFESWPRGMAG